MKNTNTTIKLKEKRWVMKNLFPAFSFIFILIMFMFTTTVLADSWATKASMPAARDDMTSSVVNGKIYVIGGYSDSGIVSTVYEYDPSDNSWTTKASMPNIRAVLASGVVNDKIYAIGGWNGTSVRNSVYEYNTSTNSWTTKTSMPTARSNHTVSVVNGKIYAIGGWNGTSHIITVEEYNPSTNSWATKASMPAAQDNMTSSVVNGKIYVIGGHSDSGIVSTVYEYDPSDNSWTTKASMPNIRAVLASGVVNDKIYAIGGWNGTSVRNSVYEYNTSTNSWTTKTSMPTTRSNHTVSVVNGKIYAIGGWNGTSHIITVEEYTPDVTCTYFILPTSKTITSSGGTGSVIIITSRSSGCDWTVTSNDSWITITSGSSGTGDGTVNYSVSANTSTSTRTGTMTIMGKTYTVTQSSVDCTYSISPTSEPFSSSGGSDSVSVSAPSGCSWTASSNAGWINITSGTSGSGNGTVGYSVSSNSSKSSRTGTMTIAGETFTVTQAGLPTAPTPNIKANDSDSTVTTGTVDTLSITVGLSAGDGSGVYCDWWVAVSTPFGWYYFDASTISWVYAGGSYTDLSPTYQGSLFDLGTAEVLNMSGLPVGTYTFYFAVEANMNGLLDIGQLYYDSVSITVESTNAVNWSGSWNCNDKLGACDVSSGSLSLSLIDDMTSGQPYLSMHGTVTFSGSPCGLLSMDIKGGLKDEVIILEKNVKGLGAVMLKILNFSSTSMSGEYYVINELTPYCYNIGTFSLNR